MSFEKDKYEVVKRAVPKDVASFCYAYFLNKRQVAKHLQDTRYISCLLYTSPSPRDATLSRMPSSA